MARLNNTALLTCKHTEGEEDGGTAGVATDSNVFVQQKSDTETIPQKKQNQTTFSDAHVVALTLFRHILGLQEAIPTLQDLARPWIDNSHNRQRVAVDLIQAAKLLAVVGRPIVLACQQNRCFQ
jgi:hypothetical protein